MAVIRSTRWASVLVAAPLLASTVWSQGAPDRRPTVAVMYFTNSSLVRNADYAPLSKGIADILISELSTNQKVRVVERDQIQKLLEEQNLSRDGRVDQSTLVQLGKILGAHHFLMGGFVIDPRETMRIDVRSVNTETSAIDYVTTVTGKAENVLDLIADLGKRVNSGLKLPPMPDRRSSSAGGEPTTVAAAPGADTKAESKGEAKGDARPASPRPAAKGNDLRATILLSRAIEASDRKDVQGAIALYKAALDVKPDFERARVLLASLEKSSGARGTNGTE